MNAARNIFDSRIVRTLLGLHNFIILSSSIILTGILSYFLHRYRYRNTHLVYEEVIAVLTLFLYLFLSFLPALKSYRGYLSPLNHILSYLWLTGLIFSSQDYSGHRCLYNSPPYVNRCRLKHTIQSFWIIGFAYLFLNSIMEALMWAGSARRDQLGNEIDNTTTTKNRGLTTTTTTGAGTTCGTCNNTVLPVHNGTGIHTTTV
ncbi:hypothetical protein QBC35DRAFT_498123 [Podospora australis]|uniref:MARVEL domain-containing protein n=1 Tax=Podospora australis TaxID=1536484 RepID=A0AAN6WX40_9PEZI|nr:hypothetical protein QBC35DRAFT_498123 [Podospora australis]